MIFKFYHIICFFILINCSIKGQLYENNKINYGTDDGLPSSECYEIIQDSKGYIWFGTDRGVVKYNGYEFKVFTTQDGLNNNVVFHIAEGADGKIWFYDKTHQLSYMHNDSIYPYKYNHLLKEHINEISRTFGITIADNNTIYFSFSSAKNENIKGITDEGIVLYNPRSSNFLFNQVNKKVTINYNAYNFKYVDHSKNLVQYSVCYKNEKNELTNSITHNPNNTFISVLRATTDLKSLWFSHHNKLFELDENGNINELYSFNEGIIELEIDKHGNLYIGLLYSGLWVFPNANTKNKYKLIDNCSVSGFVRDKNGGIWISTLEKGVFYYPSNSFSNYTPSKGKKIDGIGGADNNIVYSTEKGELVNLTTNKPLKLEKNRSKPIRNIITLNKESFIVTADRALSYFYFDINKKPILLPTSCNDWLKVKNNLYGVNDGNIYQAFKNDYQSNLLFRGDIKFNCLESNFDNSNILLGSNKGIYQYANDTLFRWKKDEPLYETRVSDMALFKNNILFSATRGNGLIVHVKDSTPYIISDKQGLISNELDNIYINGNHVYVLSKEGMSLLSYDGEKFKITNYTNNNGLLSNEVNGVFEHDDMVWVATNKGITRFNLLQQKSNIFNSPVYLTSFKVLDQIIDNKQQITLAHQENEIEFSYEAISFASKGKINYKYQMEGMDNDWVFTQSRRLRYPRLPSGDFEFNISYQHPDKTWSEPITLFKITKNKPVWEKLWFYILIIIAFVGIVLLVVQRYIKKIKKEDEIRQRITDLERRALQAQMNPHFIFNSLTSIQSLIAQHNNEKAELFLVRFSRLVRTALNQSSTSYVVLAEELELINNYIEIEALRFSNAFDWFIKIEGDIEVEGIKIPPMVIQPFIENAIEHGLLPLDKKGLINISLKRIDDSMLQWSIDDNGVGRKVAGTKHKKKGRESKGIKLVKDRLFILNKKSTVKFEDLIDGEQSKGTKVILTIPYQNG
ncbi:MAG: hypothetical protein COB15_02835 [Flavobacteriales bacterium]|nr:MAG: hypothetical protein COB15_02835 [Flavobacteriales bacterium]